jgi:RNA polymerase sigma-70 factor (ECF subfamily)
MKVLLDSGAVGVSPFDPRSAAAVDGPGGVNRFVSSGFQSRIDPRRSTGVDALERSTTRATGSDGSRDRDREGDFAALVEAHRDRAVGLAWRLLGGDRAAAEDVAQEAFLRAYRGLESFRGEARLSTWLYRIVVREAQRHRRWRTVRERFGGSSSWSDPEPVSTPAAVPDPALRRRIGEALSKLSRGQREAFVLVHLEGFTVAETAEVMARSPGTVKTHLHRARRALRSLLGDLAPDAPRHVAAGRAEEEDAHEPVQA